MQRLSEKDILKKISSGDCFECEMEDGSFALKIENYIPTICTAIHDGHRLRSNLLSKTRLSEDERRYEEDPHTGLFIQAMPITLVANDSRYEYDLNRPISSCIYNKAWGKNVWQKKLSPQDRKFSINKHQCFYRVLDALTKKIETLFGAALIIDLHSYNHIRRPEATPTFNLGSEQIDIDRWRAACTFLIKQLNKIELPNLPVDAKENNAFYGRGYLIAHINSRFQNTLVMPLEIKKVYMDEVSGEPYPLVMQALSEQFKHCLTEVSSFFSKKYTRKKRFASSDILTDNLQPEIIRLDRQLYQLAKGLETLYYINPINIESEKKRFFKLKGNYNPQFRYRQLNIDPYKFREQLYRLPVDSIRDPSIQSLYRDVINNLSEKISMLVKAGQPGFIYESLKYYGEPSLQDEENARFLLHASPFEVAPPPSVTSTMLKEQFVETAKKWGMPCKVETSHRLVASAMVSNSRKAVLIAKNLHLSETEASALIHHELGVHMATTLNAGQQRLKVFSLGLPGNTFAQEGLAILNEYHSGHMHLQRLRGLALRVLAVKEMLTHGSFRHTYSYLHEQHNLSEEDSFKLAVRVHRSGGFTKDYLYLSGVSQALSLYKERDIRNLYVGKTGFNYLSVIDEMIERQLIKKPTFCPQALVSPKPANPVLEYLMSCIHSSKGDLAA